MYLIFTKTITNFLAARRAEAFLKRFWSANSLQEVNAALTVNSIDNAFAQLAQLALDAALESETRGLKHLAITGGGTSEFITRVLRNGIEQEAARVAFCAGFLNPYVNFHRPCFFRNPSLMPRGRNVIDPMPGFKDFKQAVVTIAASSSCTVSIKVNLH